MDSLMGLFAKKYKSKTGKDISDVVLEMWAIRTHKELWEQYERVCNTACGLDKLLEIEVDNLIS